MIMASDLLTLRNNLNKSPVARARFLADTFDLLSKNGVDVEDQEVLKSLDLNLDLTDSRKFIDGLAASSIVITITA